MSASRSTSSTPPPPVGHARTLTPLSTPPTRSRSGPGSGSGSSRTSPSRQQDGEGSARPAGEVTFAPACEAAAEGPARGVSARDGRPRPPRPRGRPKTLPWQRIGPDHGDNTGGALRFAAPLSDELPLNVPARDGLSAGPGAGAASSTAGVLGVTELDAPGGGASGAGRNELRGAAGVPKAAGGARMAGVAGGGRDKAIRGATGTHGFSAARPGGTGKDVAPIDAAGVTEPARPNQRLANGGQARNPAAPHEAGQVPLHPRLHRLTRALPLHLLPLLGSLPAVVNNLRHAQHTVAWWRTFHALDRQLLTRTSRLDALAARSPKGVWGAHLGAGRVRCARERRGVRMALGEARYSLAFNAVELSTYLAGAVPLLVHAATSTWAQGAATLASNAVPALLLASGTLHVAQQAGWLAWALRAQGAAAAREGVPPVLAEALRSDLQAARRSHAVQLGLWLGFCAGLSGATGALLAVGLGPVACGGLAAASMLASRAHRLFAPRRLEVPEHTVWRRTARSREVAGPHHAWVFGDAAAQEAALGCVQAQLAAVDKLRAELNACGLRSGWGTLWRLLAAAPSAPGLASLVGAAGGRAFGAQQTVLTRAALAAQTSIWRAEAALAATAQARATRELEDLARAPRLTDASARQFAADRMRAARVTRRGAGVQQRQLGRLVQRLASWASQSDAGEVPAWAALGDAWGLPVGPGCDGPHAIAAYLAVTTGWLQDVQGALLWGAAIGVVTPPAVTPAPCAVRCA